MEEKTAFGQPETLLFPCSGAADLGQVANEVALRLRDAGVGRMSCSVGIGGHVKPLVDSAKNAKIVVGIDGCSVGCVMKSLQAEGIKPTHYYVLTEKLSAEKSQKRPVEEHIKKAFEIVMADLRTPRVCRNLAKRGG
jgi:uncharacterized metal-binding protein